MNEPGRSPETLAMLSSWWTSIHEILPPSRVWFAKQIHNVKVSCQYALLTCWYLSHLGHGSTVAETGAVTNTTTIELRLYKDWNMLGRTTCSTKEAPGPGRGSDNSSYREKPEAKKKIERNIHIRYIHSFQCYKTCFFRLLEVCMR